MPPPLFECELLRLPFSHLAHSSSWPAQFAHSETTMARQAAAAERGKHKHKKASGATVDELHKLVMTMLTKEIGLRCVAPCLLERLMARTVPRCASPQCARACGCR